MANKAVCVAFLFFGCVALVSALSRGEGYLGCFTAAGNVLNGAADTPTYQSSHITVEFCQEICLNDGLYFAILYNGTRCVCSNGYSGDGASCNSAAADGLEAGGANAISVYSSGRTGGSGYNPNYCLTGLVMDGPTSNLGGSNAPSTCMTSCGSRGYSLSAVSAGSQCQCGNTIVADTGFGTCDAPCSGLFTALCGGATSSQLWTTGYYGCFAENGAFSHQVTFGAVTIPQCQDECWAAGYEYAALSGGNNCFCGNAGPSQLTAVSNSSCFSPCNGAQTQICGGTSSISLFGATATDFTGESAAPSDWQVLSGGQSVSL